MGKPQRLKAGRLVKLPDLCKALGASESAVYRWKRAGCPHVDRDGGIWFDPAAVSEWIKSRGIKPGARGRPVGGAGGAAGEDEDVRDDLLSAKLRKELAFAERAELDVAARKGELMPRAEVEQSTIARILEVRAALLGLAARVTPRVVGQDGATVHVIVDEEARRICEGFAEGGA